MGKKKKKGTKKKKTSSESSGEAELIAYDPSDTRRYIHVSMHMENWSFADRLWPKGGFWLETGTRLFIIHKMIKKRHGAVQNIRIWKERRKQENLLLGEMKTLGDLGFEGEVRPQDRPKLQGSPPATADSTTEGGGDGGDGGDGENGDENAEEVEFTDGMVNEEDYDSATMTGDSRPMTGATEQTETAPEDDYIHIRFIYDFTPANLDDPLLLISPRV